MKILFCTRGPLTKGLGAVKVILELAESLSALGVDCTVRGRDEILSPGQPQEAFPNALRAHLIAHAADFDVVDYDHEDLPFPRTDFPPQVLMVARSPLLIHHMQRIKFPNRPGLKYVIRRLVYRNRDRKQINERVHKAAKTIAAADLINVLNHHDKAELLRRGVTEGKIVVFPNGMSPTRIPVFKQISAAIPAGPPTIAFIGTFDYRKGAREMPKILDLVRAAVPGVRLRLLGTAGLMQTESQVRACFSRDANKCIEVYPRFESDALPQHLATCWVGMFPSWLEGFGLGVLEMLAAAIPVVAYDAPGPPEMLAAEDLVPPGDAAAMADRLIWWLTHQAPLEEARAAARRRSLDFNCNQIAEDTRQAYESAVLAHQREHSRT